MSEGHIEFAPDDKIDNDSLELIRRLLSVEAALLINQCIFSRKRGGGEPADLVFWGAVG